MSAQRRTRRKSRRHFDIRNDRQDDARRHRRRAAHGVDHFTRDREGGWFDGRPKAHWKGTTADPEIALGGGQATITCPTDGASIAYRIGAPPAGRWLLYTSPVSLKRSESIEVKACRLGFKDSEIVAAKPQ